MRILLITDTHSLMGGAEKQFFRLKELLRKEGCEVFSLGFSDKDEEGADFSILKETPVKAMRHIWRLFFNRRMYLRIKHYIDKVNPDIIHLHNINKYTISLLKAVSKRTVIQTVHDYKLVCPTLWNVHNDLAPCPTGMKLGCIRKHRRNCNWAVYLSHLFFFYRRNALLRKRVQAFIAPSLPLKKYLEMSRFKNVAFIPYPVENKETGQNFSKIRDHQILFVGQIEENKGIRILIEAIPSISAQIPQIRLMVVGDGSLKDEMVALVKKTGMEKNVMFLGRQAHPDPYYEESACLVVPGIWMEQFGLVTAEAMMHRRAVIGSDRGGTAWLVEDGKTGFLFDPRNKEELSGKILTLLSDKDKITEFGNNGYKRIKEIADTKESLAKITALYRSKINK